MLSCSVAAIAAKNANSSRGCPAGPARRTPPRSRPEGLYSEPTQYEHASVRVWVRTWSEILREAKQRLEFVKKGIDHNPSLEQALAYLRHRHGDLLPDQLRQPAAVPTPRTGAAHNPAV